MNQHNKSLRLSTITVIFFSLFIILQLLVGVYIFVASPDPTIISYGEINLFEQLSKQNQDKKGTGIQAIKEKRWDYASQDLSRYLDLYPEANKPRKECLKTSINPNKRDPEALIYLNNAKIEANKTKAGKIYTIAVPVPIDQQPNKSLEILRGVAQAQNEFNCLPTDNRKFSLKVAITSEDKEVAANPERAKKVAEKLVKEPNILGVVGHLSSSVTLAARDIYNDKKLVAITPTSTSVGLSESKGKSDNYVFRTVPSDKLAAEKLGKYMLETLNKRKAAIFYNTQGKYSLSLKKEFVYYVKHKGGQVLDPELDPKLYDLSSPYFSPPESINQAIKAGAEVLMLAPDDDNTLNKVLLLSYHNKKKLSLLGGDFVYTNKILEEGVDWMDGTVVAIPWDIDAEAKSKSKSDFVTNSQNLWGAKVNWRTALAYDATQALIEAIKKEPTRSGVRKALLSIDGASGKVEFLPNGDRKNAPVQLVKIVVDPENQGKYKFQPIPE